MIKCVNQNFLNFVVRREVKDVPLLIMVLVFVLVMIYLILVNINRLILIWIVEMLILLDMLIMEPLFKILAIKVCVSLVALQQQTELLKNLVVMNTVVMAHLL